MDNPVTIKDEIVYMADKVYAPLSSIKVGSSRLSSDIDSLSTNEDCNSSALNIYENVNYVEPPSIHALDSFCETNELSSQPSIDRSMSDICSSDYDEFYPNRPLNNEKNILGQVQKENSRSADDKIIFSSITSANKPNSFDEYEIPGVIKVEADQENEGNVQLGCEDLSLSNNFHKIKEELDMDIIKEEIDDTSVVQIGCSDHHTVMNSEFYFPRVKKEKNLIETMSKESTFCETNSDDEEFVSFQLIKSVKEKSKVLYQTLMNFVSDDGRHIIVPFLENPIQEFEPNYYELIINPIDMKTILSKIRSDSYCNLNDVKSDFLLMLQNAQFYFKKDSQVFTDAEILKGVLHEKLQEIKGPSKIKIPPKILKEMKQLYNSIRFYRDGNQKRLSSAFVKLPLRKHFPEYYEIVKHPIDLELILSKINSGQYCSLRNVFGDLNLLFHNASLFYEPQLQIYRDALGLQNVAIKKYLEIEMKKEVSLDIGFVVQYMIISLFNRVFNLQSSKGKYLSNSFSKLPVFEEVDGQRRYIISFDVLKYRLDQGFYVRLDQFQNDIFTVFEKARQYSSIDSRIYTYTVTMQKKYLTMRDEIFRHKSLVLLKSRALDFREEDLWKLLDDQKQKKMLPVKRYRSSITMPIMEQNMELKSQSVNKDTVTCYCGEFVYVPPAKDEAGLSRICQILSISIASAGERILHGYQYLRAEETHYKPWQKFYDNEVFRTERRINISETEVLGKCVVLPEFYYKNCTVESFDGKDVYVCLTRYNSLLRRYSKAKDWTCELPQSLKLIDRDKPIEMTPQCLSFPQGMEKRKILLAELELNSAVSLSEQNILKPLDKTFDGHLFYLQYSTSFGIFKLGDFVYVDGSGQKSIIHINRIYSTKDEKKFVVGLRYMLASDIPVSIKGVQQEYKKEVYFTAIQQTHSMEDIIGRCCVLTMKDYIKKRCVEIKEADVYLCRSHFDEQTQSVTSLQGDIIKYYLPSTVQPDEIYFFITPLDIEKIEKSECWEHCQAKPKIKHCKTRSLSSVEKNYNKRDESVEKSIQKCCPASERRSSKAHLNSQIKLPTEQKAFTGSLDIAKINKASIEPEKNIIKRNLSFERDAVKSRLIVEKKNSNRKSALSTRKKGLCSDLTLHVDRGTKRFLQTRKKFQSHEMSKRKKKFPQKLMKNFKSITGKCPKSGYLIFCSDVRKSITEKSPGVSFSDIGKAMGMKWNKLSEKKKKVYQEKAKVINLQLFNETRDRPEKSKRCINGKSSRKFVGRNKQSIKLNGETKSFKLVGGKKPIRAFIHFVSRRKDELIYNSFNDLTEMLISEWTEQSKYSRICHRSLALKMNITACAEIKNTQIEGYALFCAEMRKIVRSKYPNAKIGLVTHLLKIEWIHLPERRKEYYQCIASMWEKDSEEIEPNFLGFTEHDIPVQQLQFSEANKWRESDSYNGYYYEENTNTFNQESSKRRLKFNNNSYFFFQSERFKELKKLYPDKHSTEIYMMTSQEWKGLSKEVKLDYQKRMKEQIFIQSLSGSTENEDMSKSIKKERLGDSFLLELGIKQETSTPKTEVSDFIEPTVCESLQMVKDNTDLPQLKYALPPKPPDYSAYNLKSCRVIVKPLGIPTDSEKSFMINDMEGGFVYLVRPFDHVNDLKKKLICSKEEFPHKSKRIKPYLCDICGKCYRKNASLISHRKKHKSKCFFRCKLCKPRKHFDSNCDFITHMDACHGPNWRKKNKFMNFIKQESLRSYFAKSTSTEPNFTEVFSNSDSRLISAGAILAEVKLEKQNVNSDGPNQQSSIDQNFEVGCMKQNSFSSTSNISSSFSLRKMNTNSYIKKEATGSFICNGQAIKKEFTSPITCVTSSKISELINSDNEQFCPTEPNSISPSGRTITIHSTLSGGIVVDGIDINAIPDKTAENITVNIGTLECSYPIIIDSKGKRISPKSSYSLYPDIKNSSLSSFIMDDNMPTQQSDWNGRKCCSKESVVIDRSFEHTSVELNSVANLAENGSTVLDPNLGPCVVLDLYNKDIDLESSIPNGNWGENLNCKASVINHANNNSLSECNNTKASESYRFKLKVNTETQSTTSLVQSSYNHNNLVSSRLGGSVISAESILSHQSSLNASSGECVSPIVIRSSSSRSTCLNSLPQDSSSSNLVLVHEQPLLNGCSDMKRESSCDDVVALSFGTNGYSTSELVQNCSVNVYKSAISTPMLPVNSSVILNGLSDKIVLDNSKLNKEINTCLSNNASEDLLSHCINGGCLKVEGMSDLQKPYHRSNSRCSQDSKYQRKQSIFPCSKCPHTFTKKSDYNKHFFDHSGSATKSFKCYKCNDLFTIVFNKESYLIWTKKKSKPLCTKCQITPISQI